MIIINYTRDGNPNADLESESIAEGIYKRYTGYIDKCDCIYDTSTESLLTAFRMLIAEDKIPHDEVVFKFENKTIEINSYGELKEGYPDDFCDVEYKMLHRLFRAKRAKKKGERNEN